jgi:cation diffusion facilitator family transporter
MMVVELVAGAISHSLALTADGWHMATHVGALGVTALAYWYARTRAGQTQFAFGTGKVFALGGYTSAALLLAVAFGVFAESIRRFISPEMVHFWEAMPVAVIGLVVNLVSAWLLDIHPQAHTDGAQHEHRHDDHDQDHHHHHHHHDQNLRAAYLHVVADALTSVLAIAALLGGRYLGWRWMDPVVGLVGAALIFKWGLGLIRDCAAQLLDVDSSSSVRDRIRLALETIGDTQVDDLHVWRAGPSQLICVVAVSSSSPRDLLEYKQAALRVAPINHLTVEISSRTAS